MRRSRDNRSRLWCTECSTSSIRRTCWRIGRKAQTANATSGQDSFSLPAISIRPSCRNIWRRFWVRRWGNVGDGHCRSRDILDTACPARPRRWRQSVALLPIFRNVGPSIFRSDRISCVSRFLLRAPRCCRARWRRRPKRCRDNPIRAAIVRLLGRAILRGARRCGAASRPIHAVAAGLLQPIVWWAVARAPARDCVAAGTADGDQVGHNRLKAIVWCGD